MFYARYVELCANKKVSPSKVALECSFNKGSVSVWKKKYEKGEDIKPTPEILVKIAEYFNVSVGYLLGIEDDYINKEVIMQKSKMVFKMPKPKEVSSSPIIRLRPEVASRIYEIVELTGLTPSQVIQQMLDYIGEDYEIK